MLLIAWWSCFSVVSLISELLPIPIAAKGKRKMAREMKMRLNFTPQSDHRGAVVSPS